MLVLLSFGLVLLATILLVVGLLNDDGINLIYLSIAASALAAIVLYLAFRRARPEKAPAGSAPEPLDRDLDSMVHDTGDADVMAGTPAAPAPAPAPAPQVVEPAPPTTVVPVVTPEAPAAEDEAWADDADWEVDDLEFPIADYDELSVAEIMPLLPQLYSDELDIVREREITTKNRATIIARLDKLAETGTEADAEEASADAVTDDDTAVVEPEPEVAPVEVPPVVTPPAPAARSASLLDDEDDDAGAFFPIADYDDLSVSQIIPLLPQLEPDELEDVREREYAGANRATLLAEIDRHLTGERTASAWSDDAGLADDEVDASVADEAFVAPVATSAGPDERDQLPIAGYDGMTVSQIRPLLTDLSDDELRQVLRHEEDRDNRRTIVSDIQRRLMADAPVVTSSSAPEPEAAAPTPAKRAPRKATKAAKAPAKKAAATSTRTATKAPAKKAAKKAAKRNASRFPIADYDQLTVADIRPRLARLTKAQLEQVRERELTGAGRKTILNDIDGRLS